MKAFSATILGCIGCAAATSAATIQHQPGTNQFNVHFSEEEVLSGFRGPRPVIDLSAYLATPAVDLRNDAYSVEITVSYEPPGQALFDRYEANGETLLSYYGGPSYDGMLGSNGLFNLYGGSLANCRDRRCSVAIDIGGPTVYMSNSSPPSLNSNAFGWGGAARIYIVPPAEVTAVPLGSAGAFLLGSLAALLAARRRGA